MFASIDTVVRVWNAATLEVSTTYDPQIKLKRVALSPDSKYIVAGGDSKDSPKATLINLSNGQQSEVVFVLKKKDKKMHVSAICFNNNGTLIGIGLSTGEILVYSLSLEKKYSHTAHRAEVTQMAFTNDNKEVIAGDLNGKISIANINQGKPAIIPGWSSTAFGSPIHTFQVSSDGKRLGVCCGNNVCIYNLSKRSIIECLPITTHDDNNYATSIAFYPEKSENIFVGTNRGQIKFINIPDKNDDDDKQKQQQTIAKNDFKTLFSETSSRIAKIGFISIHQLCVYQENDKFFVLNLETDDPSITEIEYPNNILPFSLDFPNFIQTVPNINSIRSISKRTSNIKKPQTKITPRKERKEEKKKPEVISSQINIHDSSDDEPIEYPPTTQITAPKQKTGFNAPNDILENKTDDSDYQISKLLESRKRINTTNDDSGMSSSINSKASLKKETPPKNVDVPSMPTPQQDVQKIPQPVAQHIQQPAPPQFNHKTTPPRMKPMPPKIIQDTPDRVAQHTNLNGLSSENRELVMILSDMMDEKLDSMSENFQHQMNTIHLDLLCRIKQLTDRIEGLASKK